MASAGISNHEMVVMYRSTKGIAIMYTLADHFLTTHALAVS